MKNDIYKLKNNTSMAIAPEYGCNMFSWLVNGRENLYCPDGFMERDEDFFAGGNPILFPSVGRTWDRSSGRPKPEIYQVHGRKGIYRMPCHGIVSFGTWHKKSEKIAGDGIQAEYQFFVPEEVLKKYFPFTTSFCLRYTLTPAKIKIEAFFENKSTRPAPLTLGYHPYFRVTDKSHIRIYLPCKKRLILDPELLIPIGEETLTSSVLALERDKACDMAFGRIDGNRASLIDHKAGVAVHIDFDENIEMFVIYSSPDGRYVCLEPWTKGLGGYETLRRKDWQDARQMSILRPQEKKTISVEYSMEKY